MKITFKVFLLAWLPCIIVMNAFMIVRYLTIPAFTGIKHAPGPAWGVPYGDNFTSMLIFMGMTIGFTIMIWLFWWESERIEREDKKGGVKG
jgi:hypothetical protein